MQPDDRLSEFAAKALVAWPGLSYRQPQQPEGYTHRGEAAADLVRRGLVEFRHDLPVSGYDEWQVGDHRASFRGQTCTCSDVGAPVDPKVGRLCKHRIAIMMAMRLRKDADGLLAQIIQQAAANGAERVTLGTMRIYADRGHDADTYTLTSYRERGRGQVNVGGDGQEPVRFKAADLHRILLATGWRVAGQQRQPGYQWDLYLEPGRPAWPGGDAAVADELRTGIGRLDAPDADWTERKQREQALAARFAADVDKAARRVAA
ncbi:MAG: hypothetical protein MUC79_15405 [Thiobacillaceae bacterium]|jgi:hypothetical protein|nr:hypothetical protein [Thiobacillaceae bacterium]